MGLDQLEALVHHRRRIDGDFRAHRPIGMGERFGARRGGDPLGAPLAERPARGRDGHAHDRRQVAAAERLEDRVVFGIHRQQARAGLARRRHHRVAGAHQRLLVGQRDRAAGRNGGVGRRQAGGADDRRDDQIGRFERRRDHRLGPRRGFDRAAGEAGFQLGVTVGVGESGETRAERAGDAGERGSVAAGGDRRDGEPAGRFADHLRARTADRAGRAENHQPLRFARRRSRRAAPSQGKQEVASRGHH